MLLKSTIPSSEFIPYVNYNHKFMFSFKMQINTKHTVILVCSFDDLGEVVE
jgi:hypothetical protein